MNTLSSHCWIEVILFLIIFWTASCDSIAQTFISTIAATTAVQSFNHTVQYNTTSLGIIFYITSMQYSNVVAVASLSPIELDLSPASLSQMYLNSDSRLQMMDLQAVSSNSMQIVNIPITPQSFNYTLYFKFYNLDLPLLESAKTYNLKIIVLTEGKSLICPVCISGTTLVPGSTCQCAPCPPDYYGPACTYNIITLQKNKQYATKLFSQNSVYFRIPSPPQTIAITFKQSTGTNKVTLYLQYELKPGDLAGPLNSYHDGNGDDHAWLVTTLSTTATINTRGQSVALTIHSADNTPATTVSLGFVDPNQVSMTGVIVGVVVGLVSGILVIVIICCCMRYRRKHEEAKAANPNFLNLKQIHYYFPQITACLVYPEDKEGEESRAKLMQDASINDNRSEKSRADNKDRECSVCLNPIGMLSRVRVTYCGHVFHQHCLVGWFAKTQNCPTCRHDSSRAPTEDTYEILRAFRSPFRKADLVRAIMSQHKHLNVPVALENNKMVREDPRVEESEKEKEVNYEIEDSNEYRVRVKGEVEVEMEMVSSSERQKRGRRRKNRGGTGFLSEEVGSEEISHQQKAFEEVQISQDQHS